MENDGQTEGLLSRGALAVLVLLGGGLMLAVLVGNMVAWAGAIATALTELGMAVLVVVAAGGYGYPIVRRLAGKKPSVGLKVITACGLGLWLFSTAVLVAGSAADGMLRPVIWWPVVAVGVILAALQGRKTLEAFSPPRRTDARGLLWVVLAVSVGFWLAGATIPPGYAGQGFGDSYDVLEYHLQVPREFFENGRIGQLKHNCYSYYPLGVEMLSLMGMSLRDGPYKGMYLAKFMHGIFGALTVAGLFLSLKRSDEATGRFSAALMGTAPFALYLSWMAMVELSMIFYLTMAALWLREWIADPSWRPAVCIGMMAGAACAMKYLSVGFIVAPLIAVMIVLSVRSARKIAHVAAVAAVTTLLFSPWLIRNYSYTHNPVFPLATGIFGPGHWSDESAKRWNDGHGPEVKPPAPVPPGWQAEKQQGRAWLFVRGLFLSGLLGPLLPFGALLAIAALASIRGKVDPFNWSLVGLLAVQLVVWVLATHEMPLRFIVPALVPICLLTGGMLARLSRVKVNPWKKDASPPVKGPWGLPVAGACVLAAVVTNLLTGYGLFATTRGLSGINGAPGEVLTFEASLRRNGIKSQYPLHDHMRFLLVGEAQAFYFPPHTIYATAFDAHPLDVMLRSGMTAAQIADELRREGVTHVLVNWEEIWRLATTYGYPASLSTELYRRWQSGRGPGLAVLEGMRARGLRLETHLGAPPTTSRPSERVKSLPKTKRWYPSDFPPGWPTATLYVFVDVDKNEKNSTNVSPTSKPTSLPVN